MNPNDYRPKMVNGKRVASSEYRCWQMMKNRCLNSRAPDYDYYGGSGITICARWHSFDMFMEDMGPQPFPGATIERKDSTGEYCKDNCEWADRKTQARNRAYCKRLNGKHTWEWAQELGLSLKGFQQRLWKFRKGRITEAELYAARKI